MDGIRNGPELELATRKPAVREKALEGGGVELEFGCLEIGAERPGEWPNEAIDKGGGIVVRSKFARSAAVVGRP